MIDYKFTSDILLQNLKRLEETKGEIELFEGITIKCFGF
jgi:hypothetical protein